MSQPCALKKKKDPRDLSHLQRFKVNEELGSLDVNVKKALPLAALTDKYETPLPFQATLGASVVTRIASSDHNSFLSLKFASQRPPFLD
jgi:hypothetical protein